ncbi:MAG: OmpA family protein [Parvularculaceae bacterium]
MPRLKKKIIAVAPAFLYFVTPLFAFGQETVQFDESPPTVQDVLAVLGISGTGSDLDDVIETRGVRYKNADGSTNIQTDPSSAPSSPGQSSPSNQSDGNILSIPIQFALNSYEIPTQYREHLNVIGDALNSPEARGVKIRITGHTDATGSTGYNEALSVRRSQAVVRYLVSAKGVNRDQLLSDGQGEEHLLPGIPQNDARNRRVDFEAL